MTFGTTLLRKEVPALNFNDMSYGKIEYNEDGLPKCEICGEHYHRVTAHVRQVHGLSAKEYKKEFGFDLQKGICSKESSQKSRDKAMSNYDKVIGENLIKGGEETRFKVGSRGRTREQVSQQTLNRLRENRFNYNGKK
jgi:hypothetical protein